MNKNIFIIIIFLMSLPLVLGFKDDLFCTSGTNCVIGFYAENASNAQETFPGADCNITITNTGGTNVVNNVRMTNNSDGWHNYTFTNTNTGHYRYRTLCIFAGQSGSDYGEVFINNSIMENLLNVNTSVQNVNVTVSGIVVNNTAIANQVWNTNLSTFNTTNSAGNFLGDNSDWSVAIILGLLLVTAVFIILGANYNADESKVLRPFFLMMGMLMIVVVVWVCRLIVQINEPTATNILTTLDSAYRATLTVVVLNTFFYVIILFKNMFRPIMYFITGKKEKD